MPITPLPSLDRTSSAFRADVDLFFGTKLPAFVAEANAQAAEIIAAGLLSGEAIAAAADAQAAAAAATTAAAAVGVAVDWANNIFAAGTRIPFAQPSAPTGWTQDISDNATNRMLRVVNTAGGGVAGTNSPILNNVVPSHTHTFTTGTESAYHTHNDSGHTHGISSGSNGSSGNSGSGVPLYGGGTSSVGYASLSTETALHTHGGTTVENPGAANWAPRYVDLIICAKN